MPRYRFTTDDGENFDASKERLSMPNDKAASDQAQRALAHMAKDKLPDGSHFNMRVSVENENDEVIY